MSGMKILLVEDTAAIQLTVKAALGKRYDVTCVATAEHAQVELARTLFDLIILDVGLPGEDGFQLCANIRSEERYRQVPIVFLTGKNQTRDKIMAFSLGADDYIVKPFDIGEFQARIDAKMRRIQESSARLNHFSHGPFQVALAEQKIYAEFADGRKDLELSTIEFKLLYYFLRHVEHVLSREQILNEVWGLNTHVTDRAVDTYIYSLRKKLGPLGTLIQAVPRVGYKLSRSETNQAA